MCCLSPLIFLFVTWFLFSEAFPPRVKASVRHLALVPVIINSFFNPVIYTVRKKEFRMAFIKLLLRKSLPDAEAFHRRLFGLRNSKLNKKAKDRNRVPKMHPTLLNGNHEGNPEVHVSDTNFEDKISTTTTAT